MEKVFVLLIVEDNFDHFELIKIALIKNVEGLHVLHADSAKECLQIIKEENVDIVLLDYSLPDHDGLWVLEAIQKLDKQLPVLIVTGQGNERIAVEAMKKGAVDYLIKTDNYLVTLPLSVAKVLSENMEKLRLHTTELYYRDLVENSTDGIYLLDEKGHIRLVNSICWKMTGFNKRKLIGRHFSFLFEENEYQNLLDKIKKDQGLKRLAQYQTNLVCSSGKLLPVELSVIPVKRNRCIIGYQGIVRDISERIQMQAEQEQKTLEIERMNEELLEKNKRLQELNKLKTQFVSNVGHELRTPLNGVLGYAELLKEKFYGELNDGQLKAINNIIGSGHHLLNLINELLDFAKIQSGKFKLYKEISSVYDIVEAALETISPSVKAKKLQLHCSVAEKLPNLFVDSQKIYQVLLNILSNAVKFTSKGEIELKVFLETLPAPVVTRRAGDPFCGKENRSICFLVRDTGIGIPENELNNIFQDFHQVDGSFTRSYGGTGLGLSLAKFLVELHNGEIFVESTPHVGSTFRFTIPCQGGQADDQENKKQAPIHETEFNFKNRLAFHEEKN